MKPGEDCRDTVPIEGVILTKLSPPNYYPLARQARIEGKVEVRVGVRRDGSIQSVDADLPLVPSGSIMLIRSALESAQTSKFECNDCEDALTYYSLFYTFKLTDPNCEHQNTGQRVTQSNNQITVVAQVSCVFP